MTDKPYVKIGDTYFPKVSRIRTSDDEVIGDYWKVWREGGHAFYEYDAGHLFPEFVKVEILLDEFLRVRDDIDFEKELRRKYG